MNRYNIFTGTVSAAAIAWLAASAASAAEPAADPAVALAGQPGEQFYVRDCTGPASGKTLCYYCRYGDRPVVSLFVRELPEELGPLVQQLDQAVLKHRDRRWASLVVYLGKDTREAETALKTLSRQLQLRKTPLTIYRDDPAKLTEVYRVSPDAPLTAITWKNGLLRGKQVFSAARLDKQRIGELTQWWEGQLSDR